MASCSTVDQLLIQESGRISKEIFRKTLNTNFYIKLIKQQPWMDEMGEAYNINVFERTVPTDPLTWNSYSGSTATCFESTDQNVDGPGQTLRLVQLNRLALNGPDLCLRQIRFAHDAKGRLDAYVNNLADTSKWVWANRYQDEYIRVAEHKVIATAGLPEGTSSFPLVLPTSDLTMGILKHEYVQLNYDGGDVNPLDRENGRPVYGLLSDMETTDALIKNNSDIRQDFRWSDRVNELLTPLGVDRSYGGFYFINIQFPPRYNFVNGAWVRVYPYETLPTTKGNKREVSTAYREALYQDSVIYHPDVMVSLVPKPVSGLPKGITFSDYANQYRGEFVWRNVLTSREGCNPDGDTGYFRSIFVNGTQPIRPDLGRVIRHRRCGTALNLTNYCY